MDAYPVPPRGVWLLPFRDAEGRELAAAITADGRRVAELPIVDRADIPELEVALRAVLDRVDPPRAALRAV
jgi:hypothetical protein